MFRTRALAVATVATTALALTACGSDSLSEGELELRAGRPPPARSAVDPALVAKLPGEDQERRHDRHRHRRHLPAQRVPRHRRQDRHRHGRRALRRRHGQVRRQDQVGALGVRRDHPRRPERQVRRRASRASRSTPSGSAGDHGQLLQGRHPVGDPEGQPQGRSTPTTPAARPSPSRRAPSRPTRTCPGARRRAPTRASRTSTSSSTPTRPRSPRPSSPARPTPCSSTCRRPSPRSTPPAAPLELLGEQYDSAPYGYVLKKERHRLRRGHRRGAQAAQGRRHLRPDPRQVEDRGRRHQRLRREPDGQLTP